MNLWKKIKNDFKYSFFGEESLSNQRKTAIKNLISVAKDKVYEQDPMALPTYDVPETIDYNSDTIRKVQDSITELEKLLEEEK